MEISLWEPQGLEPLHPQRRRVEAQLAQEAKGRAALARALVEVRHVEAEAVVVQQEVAVGADDEVWAAEQLVGGAAEGGASSQAEVRGVRNVVGM